MKMASADAQTPVRHDDAPLFAVPTGRPPRAAKRGSMPDILRKIRGVGNPLARHSSQPRLSRKGSDVVPATHGSLTNLSERRNSLVLLETLKTKTLSASNLAAVSDSNLSIKEAVPLRSYDLPNTASNLSKQCFEQLVKRYFYQLTEGCGKDDCRNKFCKSCKVCVDITPATAIVFSIELASRDNPNLCPNEKYIDKPLPWSVLNNNKDEDIDSRPFIHTLLCTTPFSSFFNKHEKSDTTAEPEVTEKAHRKYSKRKDTFSNILPKDLIKQKAKESVLSSSNSMTDLALIGRSLFSRSRKSISRQISSSTGNLHSSESEASDGPDDHHSLCPSVSTSSSYNTGFPSQNSSPLQVYGSNEDLTSQLEEFERQLSREMAMGDTSEFSLTHLTLPMLESTVQNCIDTEDSSFLLNTIRTVFTSSEALNQSFKLNEDLPNSLKNLDIEAVRKAFSLLTSKMTQEANKSLCNALDILLSDLAKTVLQPQDLNQILILLECPIFRKRRHHSLRQKLCHVIAALSEECRTDLVRVLINCDSEIFERKIMGIYKDHFMLSLRHNQRSEPSLLDIAQTLSVFYDVNLRAAEVFGEPLVPVKLFYETELSRKLDFRHEYETWIANKEDPAAPEQKFLLDFPFLFDPSCKVHILHLDAVVKMRKEYQEAILHQARITQVQKYLKEVNRTANLTDSIRSAMCPFLVLEVRRDHLLEDTLHQIKLKECDLSKPLKIRYVGGGEQGLDMGGLQKEFFQLICEKVFDPAYGMFQYSEETRTVWFNGNSQENLEEFELVGIILGLSIYNGVILDVHFPTLVYKKLQGCHLGLNDLIESDPILGKSLKDLLEYDGTDVEDVFCQTFQISASHLDTIVTIDLIPSGGDIPVTNQNRHQFVKRYVEYTLIESIAKQFDAFHTGFYKVCSKDILALFQPEEIELLVCGSPELDFRALEKSAAYDDGFYSNHTIIKAFWEIVHDLTEQQKKLLLHFITGSDRVPLKGLSHLPIVIQRNGGDSDRLPTAMTCFNRLLLPAYDSKEKLKDRLITAIENGKGFGLT